MEGTRVKRKLKMKSNINLHPRSFLPAAGAMLSASAPVCYALVLEAIKGNNAIIESGKNMPISAYMVRTLECCSVLRIMSTEF